MLLLNPWFFFVAKTWSQLDVIIGTFLVRCLIKLVQEPVCGQLLLKGI